jgi:hypothetical protein
VYNLKTKKIMITLKVTKYIGEPFEKVIEITAKTKKEVKSMYVQKYGWMYKDEHTTYEYIKK